MATQDDSISTFFKYLFPLFVILPTFSFSPVECVLGIKPIYEQSLSKFLNLSIVCNSVNIVIAVINPIPGIVHNKGTILTYFSVFDNCLICLVKSSIFSRRYKLVVMCVRNELFPLFVFNSIWFNQLKKPLDQCLLVSLNRSAYSIP